MKKKGFTLVELLAVIEILAILVIIALPNVLSMFRQAKENSFKEEAQKLFQTAETAYINSAMGSSEITCFSDSGPNKLDLTGRSLTYRVDFKDGKITTIQVKDGTYNVNKTNASGLKVTDIDTVTSGDLEITQCPAS